MASLGVRVHIISKKPSIAVVVLEGTKSAPTLVESFLLTTSEKEIVGRINDLSSALGSRLDGLSADGVAIRRADFSRASNTEGPKTRLLVEGALVQVSCGRVEATVCASGRDLAQTCGIKKDDLDSEGNALIDNPKMFEAAAAAWSILPE